VCVYSRGCNDDACVVTSICVLSDKRRIPAAMTLTIDGGKSLSERRFFLSCSSAVVRFNCALLSLQLCMCSWVSISSLQSGHVGA